MNKEEYMEEVSKLGINLEKLNITVGSKTNIPNSIGCYREENVWHFFDVNERQSFVITKSGSEDEIFSYLYLITKALYKQYYSDLG